MSLELAFRALYAVGDLQPAGVSDVARALEAPKSSVHRELRKLQDIGWVRQSNDGHSNKWTLTGAPLTLAQKVAGDSNLKTVALEEMQALQDRFAEAIHLAVPLKHSVVIVERLECPQSIRVHWAVGNNAPLHASANGRAMLAFSSPSQYRELFPTSFDPVAKKTTSNAKDLEAKIQEVREKGYAFVFEELRDDVASIAAPIFGSQREPVASISIFLPSYRVPSDVDAVGQAVREATNRISQKLVFH